MRTPTRPRIAAAAGLALVVLAAAVGVGLGGVGIGGASAPSPALIASSAAAQATPTPSSAPPWSAPAIASPEASAAPSVSPTPTPTPSPSARPPIATRVVVPDLGIDLAITKSPPAGVYPYCNVAMAFGEPFGQPGQDRATYLFAHARVGMFYPIYNLTILKRTPNRMVGMLVDVYTSDSTLHVYRITKVLAHQLTLDRAASATRDELWLQTSEGPHGTPGKTQVVAEPVSVTSADYAASHPKVRIVKCGT